MPRNENVNRAGKSSKNTDIQLNIELAKALQRQNNGFANQKSQVTQLHLKGVSDCSLKYVDSPVCEVHISGIHKNAGLRPMILKGNHQSTKIRP